MIDVYECIYYIRPGVSIKFFTTKEISYDLGMQNFYQVPKVKTSPYGQSSLSFRGLSDIINRKPETSFRHHKIGSKYKRVQNNDQLLEERKLLMYQKCK